MSWANGYELMTIRLLNWSIQGLSGWTPIQKTCPGAVESSTGDNMVPKFGSLRIQTFRQVLILKSAPHGSRKRFCLTCQKKSPPLVSGSLAPLPSARPRSVPLHFAPPASWIDTNGGKKHARVLSPVFRWTEAWLCLEFHAEDFFCPKRVGSRPTKLNSRIPPDAGNGRPAPGESPVPHPRDFGLDMESYSPEQSTTHEFHFPCCEFQIFIFLTVFMIRRS